LILKKGWEEMKLLKQFLDFRKALKKIKAIKKIIKANADTENETKLLINNIKVNVELLINKFPELKEIYLECLDELK
jgi:hypothetical protein